METHNKGYKMSSIEDQGHSDCVKEIDSLRGEKRRIQAVILRKKTTREELYSVNKHGIRSSPLVVFVMMWIIELFTVLLTVYFLVFDPGMPLTLVLILVFIDIMVALQNLIFVYPRVRKKRKIDADIRDLQAELRRIEERIKTL